MTSHQNVMVWLDHQEARIFRVGNDDFAEELLRSPTHHVHRHPKGATAEANHPDDARHFFRDVAGELESATRVLVVGPSTAKLQFIRYVREHAPALEPRITGVETVDHPTDPQLVAYARHYFAADGELQMPRRIGTHA